METLQTNLFEAATQGSINSLQELLKVDPLILDRAAVNYFNETPLHVASMLGHIHFVEEMIRIKPELVNKVSSPKSTALHMAAAKGHVEVVMALLSVDREVCLSLDRNKLTPLHLAAAEGHVEVVKLLLAAQPDAARIGQSILHLCVRRYQLEVMEVVVKGLGDEGFLNSTDEYGNTILHLAVADKQVETVRFLLSVGVKSNVVNEEGMTALDVLIRSKRDVRDHEMEKLLKHENSYTITNDNNTRVEVEKNDWESSLKRQEKRKSSLMVVAVLIATMAFQIGTNPPGGVWQNDEPDSKTNTTMEAGTSVYAHRSSPDYRNFYTVNMVAFIASLSIILLLMSGLPMQRRFTMWILMVLTWISLTAIAICYIDVILVLTPADKYDSVKYVITIPVLVWVLLIAFVLIAHVIRLVVKLVKKMWKLCARGRNNNTTSADVAV